MSFYLAHLGVEGFSVLYSIYQLASVYNWNIDVPFSNYVTSAEFLIHSEF